MLFVTILQKLSATCAAELDLPNQLSTLGNEQNFKEVYSNYSKRLSFKLRGFKTRYHSHQINRITLVIHDSK